MDDEDLVKAVLAYTSRHALEVRELLGSGIHGIVYVVESKTDPGRRALKLHRDSDAYLREKMVYERLSEKRIDSILGFQVPVPLRFDHESMGIEMTIVMPPFVLDFASASLDALIEFSEEIWADWETAKLEQFGSQWGTVKAILSELVKHGVHMLDPSPSNIRFH